MPRLNREVAEFLMDHPPRDVAHTDLDTSLESIESPWPRREENLLQEEWSKLSTDDEARVRTLITLIKKIGMEPCKAL